MAFSDQLFETRETLPGSRTVTYTYKNTGELATVDGAETYKQSYDYDSQGRMSTLSTYKTPTVPQDTTWAYNNRGFMTSKTYADGKGTTYTYTDDGELATRVWDRGITTTYSYDNAGRQTGIDYSDTTPDITYTYDWMGNPATVTDAEGTRDFSYNYTTSGHPGLASVTVPGIVASIDYTYDAYGRRTAMSLMKNSSAVLTNNYGYDTTSGKLNKIDDGTYSANYTYADGTGLITQNQIKLESTSAVVTTHNRTYDTRLNNYHLLNTSNTTGATTRTYSYLYNDKDQRTKLTLPDGSYWEYSYDDKGQVTGGVKKNAAGNLIAGQYFGYSYDGIGNRLYAETKLAALKLTYTTNNVNQYTQINNPGIVPVLGEADADTTVQAVRTDASNLTGGKQKTIPTRSGKYFSGAFTGIDNSSAAQTIPYDVYAIKDETTTQQIQKASSSYTVPKAVTSPTYDTDGNMTSDGTGWNYTWNGENRKIAAEKSDMKLEFVYDFMGRRVSKKVYTGSTGNWTLSTHQKFVYNGYKQIAEYNASDVLQKTYTWQPVSLDVPLWVNDNSTYYYYIVDGNKNVRAMVDISGTLAAEYDYNPFGKIVMSSGAYKDTNKYRFSSEYHDDETGLNYYKDRYFHILLARWTKRDSIQERGGVNLYGFVNNNPVKYWDNLGYSKSCVCGPDVTGWYMKDIQAHMKHKKKNGSRLDKFRYQAKYLMSHKWMNFNLEGCATGKCKNTVSVCGTCVRKNILGNIMFGLISRDRVLGPDPVKFAYSHLFPNVFYKPHSSWKEKNRRKDNLAAFSLGRYLYNEKAYIKGLSKKRFCKKFKNALKVGLNHFAKLHGSKTKLTPTDMTTTPDKNFDTSTCSPCKNKTYCKDNVSSIKYFKQLESFYNTNEDRLDDILSTFWERYDQRGIDHAPWGTFNNEYIMLPNMPIKGSPIRR